MDKLEELKKLNIKYDSMQKKYGDKTLDSINSGGCVDNPRICFVFMNPTGRNIASSKEWLGIKSPWIGTKNIWKLFYNINIIDGDIYNEIVSKKPNDWDYEFSEKVYDVINNKKVFITNLGKCTQIDARPLSNEILSKYKGLLFKEIDIIKPNIIITFGNQVSSIILNKNISVSKCRKKFFDLRIKNNNYKVFPIYYPIGNGIFNIDKSIEDIIYIMDNYLN